MTKEQERLQILKMVESGRITIEEGAGLLGAIDEASANRAPKSRSMWSETMSARKHERTFDVGEECVVIVEASSGNLKVYGWDRQRVAVRSPGRQVRVVQDGPALRVGPYPDGVLILNTPRLCDLTLRLTSGDARLRGIRGQINIETVSGDVVAKNLSGDLRLHAVSGDVSLLSCRLTSLAIDTISGDCLVESGLRGEGRYYVSSVSGGLRLLIPEDQPCTLRIQATSGRFRCALPHQIVRDDRGETQALINGGGVEFRVTTTSGDVVVKAARRLAESAEEAADAEGHRESDFGAEPRPEGGAEGRPEPDPFGLDEQATELASVAAQRMSILRSVEAGVMTVDQALASLRTLEGDPRQERTSRVPGR